MRTTTTALAIALTMMAAAQPRALLTAIGEPFTSDILDNKAWYRMESGDYVMHFGQSSINIMDAMQHEQRLMTKLAPFYLGRKISEEVLPPYMTGLSDTYTLSLALKADEARVIHYDVYVLGTDTVALSLMLNKHGAMMYCIQP